MACISEERDVPHLEDTERLPSLAALQPQAAARMMAAVEMLIVCAPSPPVPTMSSSFPLTCTVPRKKKKRTVGLWLGFDYARVA